MKTYHKIETLYERDGKTKKLIEGKFRNSSVEFLKNCNWVFTEKVDGTNTRIHWDGHEVHFAGRTDAAEFSNDINLMLEGLFGGEDNAQLFEQKFGGKEVILFGETYGPKIQKVGNQYCDKVSFILFDVLIGETYLTRESVEEIADYFNLPIVPIIMEGTIDDAVKFVKTNPDSVVAVNGAKMEGVVGRPAIELKDRTGNRIIVKIKYRDFH